MLQQERLDPFTQEIIRAGIIATTDEMKTNLMRTAYNPIVYEALDFTVALTDAQGNLVSIGLGLPSFIRGISDTVKAFIKFFGSDIQPGDILLTNDAYTHGSHLNHVITAVPVFHEGEIIAFSCSEPHWWDIGGQLGGASTDIFSEGLQIPYVKVYKKGVLDKELVSIISSNVRNPDLAMGDFRGQIACIKTGEKRVLHMANKYGKKNFTRAIDAIMDQSEDFARREIERIPEGTYEAEQFMDDDGVDFGKNIQVKIKIKVKGDSMTVDLTDVGRQVRGYYNSGAGKSGVQMGFKTITSPMLQPVNDGSFRPLEVILPPGTAVSATKPSAMKCWMTVPMTIADTMWKALAPVIPDRISAGHHADLCSLLPYPIDPKTRRVTLKRMTAGGGIAGGGFGAKYNEDGMSATICMNDGDTHNHPVESMESHEGSVIVLRRGLRQDSGGPGKYRGGLGVVAEVLYFRDAMLNSHMERTMCPPWGALGGKPALANKLVIRNPKQTIEFQERYSSTDLMGIERDVVELPNNKHPNGKTANMQVSIGSIVSLNTGGGGGFGNPLERDPEKVLQDYVNEYISPDSVERDYGVVIDKARNQVDVEKTKQLRVALSRTNSPRN